MDHFALETDTLYKAIISKTIHRNFMGYTASKTKVMIGLGVSSISDSWYGFAQNVKGIEEYYHLINEDIIPVFRGHILSSILSKPNFYQSVANMVKPTKQHIQHQKTSNGRHGKRARTHMPLAAFMNNGCHRK